MAKIQTVELGVPVVEHEGDDGLWFRDPEGEWHDGNGPGMRLIMRGGPAIVESLGGADYVDHIWITEDEDILKWDAIAPLSSGEGWIVVRYYHESNTVDVGKVLAAMPIGHGDW